MYPFVYELNLKTSFEIDVKVKYVELWLMCTRKYFLFLADTLFWSLVVGKIFNTVIKLFLYIYLAWSWLLPITDSGIIDLKSSNFLICMEGCQINQPVWLIIPSYWYRLYENIILFSFSKQRISMIMFQLNSEAGYKEPLASCNPISCRSYPVYPSCWLPSILGWGSTPAIRPDQGGGIWLPLPWMGHCYTRGQTPTKPYHRHKSISIKIMTWGLIKRKLILLGLCPN